MNKTTRIIIAGGMGLLAACQSIKNNGPKTALISEPPLKEIAEPVMQPKTMEYPITKKIDHLDNYHGTEIADPYRWLENDTTEEVAAWVKAQNKVTFNYLDKIPFRNQIKERLTKIWNYPKYENPIKRGENYYFKKNDGLQNQAIVYVQKGLTGTPEVFLDPNKFSEDGTTSLTMLSFSKNNRYVAYGTSGGGSDWNEFQVMDATTKQKLSDKRYHL